MLGVVPEMYTPNPTYGDDATGAACTTKATVDGEEFNIPDCMPWAVFDGKILFRLSDYEYTRSRASEACQVSYQNQGSTHRNRLVKDEKATLLNFRSWEDI